MTKLTYTMFISFIGNTFISILKILAGFFGKSTALLADGIHTFSDMSTDLISIADDNFNDESKNVQYFFNLLVGVVILGLGLTIIYLGTKISTSVPNIWLLVISLSTIVLKFILAKYVLSKGILYKNLILVNNAHESNNDVISSVIVFLGLTIMQFTDAFPVLRYTDMIVSVIVGLFIIKSGFDVLYHVFNMIFGIKENNERYLTEINNIIKTNPNVVDIDSLQITKYGNYYELKSSINLKDSISLKDANVIIHNIGNKIKKNYPKIDYIFIKINVLN